MTIASQIAKQLRRIADDIEDLEDEAQDAGVVLDSLESLTDDLTQALADTKEEIEMAESGESDKEEEEED